MADVLIEYYDEETGETIRPDQYDLYDLEAAQRNAYEQAEAPEPEQPVEIPSWISSTGNAIGQGIGSFVSGVAGGIDYLEDKTGLNMGIGDYILESQEPYKQARQSVLDRVPEGSAQDYAAQVTSGISSFLPNLAAPGKLAVQAGLMGMEAFGRQYDEMEDLPFDEREKSALYSGGINAAASAIPLSPALKAGTPLTKRLILSGAGGGVGNVIGEAGETYADFVGTGEVPSQEEFFDRLKTAGIVGAGTGAGMGLAGAVLNRASRVPEPDIQSRQAEIDAIAQRMTQEQPAIPVQDGTPLNNPELSTSRPVGDLPSVEQQTAMLNAPEVGLDTAVIPETRDFTARNPMESDYVPVGDLPSVQEQQAMLDVPQRIADIIPEKSPEIEASKLIAEEATSNQQVKIGEAALNNPDIIATPENAALVVEQANIAEVKARQLDAQARALLESGSGEGVEVLNKVQEIKQQKERLENWSKHPEIQDQLSMELGIEVPNPSEPVLDNTPPPRPEVKREQQTAPKKPDIEFKPENGESFQKPIEQIKEASKKPLKSNVKSQKGALFIPKFDIGDVYEFVKNRGKENIQYNPAIYKYFNGKFRKTFAFQSSIAKKFPEFKPFYDEPLKYHQNKNAYAYDSWDLLQDYRNLDDVAKKKFNDVAIAARLAGKAFQATDETLMKYGLNADQIKAWRAKETWAQHNLDMLKNEEIAAAESSGKKLDMNLLEQKYQELKQSNYVPLNRYGKYRLDVYDELGNLERVDMSDSRRELQVKAQQYKLAGKTPKIEEIMQAKGEEYRGVSPDILNTVGDESSGIPILGFKKHFAQSRNIEGFDLDLERSMSEYTASMANYIATKQFKRQSNELFKKYKQMPEKEAVKYGPLLKNAREYHDFMTTPSKEQGQFGRFFSDYYLAGNIKTAAVNSTQAITTTYPMIAKYVPGTALMTERIVARAVPKTMQYARLPKAKFVEKYPELASAMNAADRKGIISSNVFNELIGKAYHPGAMKSYRDMLHTFNNITERANRVHAFIAGWETYPEALKTYYKKGKNGEPPSRQQFAENFVRETQFDYSKVDRPAFAREGLGKMAFIFRTWPLNYLKLVKNSALEGQFGVLTRLAGSMGAIGGITTIPLIGNIMMNMEAAGIDPKKAIRDYVDSVTEDEDSITNQLINYIPYANKLSKKERAKLISDTALYSPQAQITGTSLTGALMVGDLNPDIEKGILPGLTRTLMGIAPDPLQRVGKAAWLANEMDSPYRAVEALLPEMLRNPAVALRWAKEGVKDVKGGEIISKDKLSAFDIAKKTMGFTPLELAKSYEKANSLEMIKKQSQDNDNINFKLAKALSENDNERFQSLIAENIKNNQEAMEKKQYHKIKNIDTDSIYKYMEYRVNKDMSDLQKLPDTAKLEALKVMERFAD